MLLSVTVADSDIKENIMTKKAFTLSEVLITLGIIGVVMAMTLPALIGKWQKTVFANKVKYAYSVISNAFLMAEQEYGDPTQWDWGSEQTYENNKRVVETYLLPYLNTLETGRHYGNYQIAALKNGLYLMFILDGCTNPDACNPVTISALYIIVSTKPKTIPMQDEKRDYSREDFILRFSRSNKKLNFFHWGNFTRDGIKNHSLYGCNKNILKNKRLNCGALIFYDGWEIKDDYPW